MSIKIVERINAPFSNDPRARSRSENTDLIKLREETIRLPVRDDIQKLSSIYRRSLKPALMPPDRIAPPTLSIMFSPFYRLSRRR